ncbi:MAG: hypothetical protein Q7U64_11155 [Desulfocapsaceae bacterium]|nr:hypothetical protein [Desulfocapsaceae bacterium]
MAAQLKVYQHQADCNPREVSSLMKGICPLHSGNHGIIMALAGESLSLITNILKKKKGERSESIRVGKYNEKF